MTILEDLLLKFQEKMMMPVHGPAESIPLVVASILPKLEHSFNLSKKRTWKQKQRIYYRSDIK
jgi:hypothetical protein|uniref:Uncharacterized protein n=1 Tax=Populus trichocarpa TaxID=3694 RepID=A0A3N7G7G6_POPTR